MELLSDGQHKHGGEKMNCFFCLKDKEHCQYWGITESPDNPPELRMLYKQKFVICPECTAKGPEFLAKHVLQWMGIQGMLSRHGVGYQEIEDHKRTGRMPKFKKRKNR
jgi:hypothetical protein